MNSEGQTRRDEDAGKVVGMTSINTTGNWNSVPSLDELAATVRSACVREGQAQDEMRMLRRLTDEAESRYKAAQDDRVEAERRLREHYNAAVTP